MFFFLDICSRDKDEVQKVYEAELSFLESCLKVNPKSYGSWHHRGWVSARLPRPDWARELSLCDRCLSLDDRNCKSWIKKKNFPCRSLCCFHPCLTLCSPRSTSSLLGLPPDGCEDVRCACRSGVGFYRSSYRLQLLQLLQLALPQHPAAAAPPGVSRAPIAVSRASPFLSSTFSANPLPSRLRGAAAQR